MEKAQPMQPTKSRNKAAGSGRYQLSCQEWRVDEEARIEIRSGVILGHGRIQMERRERKLCSEPRGGFRNAVGFAVRQPAA